MSTFSGGYYVICINGVETDYLLTKEAAEITADSWLRDGYEDVVIAKEDRNAR